MSGNQFKAIGIGEILWDILPEGKKLGGAPTNFAFHANQLNIESAIISACGKDELGDEILARINQSDINNFVSQNEYPTGTVSVTLDKEGIPSYIIHENVAWDAIDPSMEVVAFAGEVDAICYGSLAQRSEKSRNSIQTILRSANDQTLRIFDINLRQHFYSKDIIKGSLDLANALKINEDEILVFAELFDINGNEIEIINTIRASFDLSLVALTKGANGSWLLTENENSYLDTPKVSIVDTVGAGDSFTAAMVAGLLYKKPLQEVHRLAVDVSAFVRTQKGATPDLPKELIDRLHS